MKIKTILIASALCGTVLFGASAQASTYSFDFTGPNLTAEGFFVTSNTANSDGGFDLTSISGIADGLAITGLVPAMASGQNTSPDGLFYYDNEMFPAANPVVDNDGLLFNTTAEEINIYSNGPSAYADAKASGGSYTDFGTAGTFSISAVPEPSTWLLMIVGIGGIGLMLRRPKRSLGFNSAASAA